MLIDFHTHAFPDSIAPKTVAVLKKAMADHSGLDIEPFTDGTVGSLEKSAVHYGVDISVVLPIATKESQTEKINTFAKNISSPHTVSFASLYPYQADRIDVLKTIAEAGFAGIKLHPEYQEFFVDCAESIEIINEAEKLGLYVVLHTGEDGGYPPPYHCLPDRLAHALEYFSGKNVIAAHMGGFRAWDDVEKYLAGTEIYMDTAMITDFMPKAQCERIIKKHGADKILFGTDMPWDNPSDTLEYLTSLDLSSDELDKIKYKNAMKILNIKA